VTFEPESAARIAFGMAAVILSVIVCVSLAIRRSWPSLAGRVVTSLVVLLALVMSPNLVLVLMDPALHRGFDAGVWFHPGPRHPCWAGNCCGVRGCHILESVA